MLFVLFVGKNRNIKKPRVQQRAAFYPPSPAVTFFVCDAAKNAEHGWKAVCGRHTVVPQTPCLHKKSGAEVVLAGALSFLACAKKKERRPGRSSGPTTGLCLNTGAAPNTGRVQCCRQKWWFWKRQHGKRINVSSNCRKFRIMS